MKTLDVAELIAFFARHKPAQDDTALGWAEGVLGSGLPGFHERCRSYHRAGEGGFVPASVELDPSLLPYQRYFTLVAWAEDAGHGEGSEVHVAAELADALYGVRDAVRASDANAAAEQAWNAARIWFCLAQERDADVGARVRHAGREGEAKRYQEDN